MGDSSAEGSGQGARGLLLWGVRCCAVRGPGDFGPVGGCVCPGNAGRKAWPFSGASGPRGAPDRASGGTGRRAPGRAPPGAQAGPGSRWASALGSRRAHLRPCLGAPRMPPVSVGLPWAGDGASARGPGGRGTSLCRVPLSALAARPALAGASLGLGAAQARRVGVATVPAAFVLPRRSELRGPLGDDLSAPRAVAGGSRRLS